MALILLPHIHGHTLKQVVYVSISTRLIGAGVYISCYSLHFTVATEHLLVTCVLHIAGYDVILVKNNN